MWTLLALCATLATLEADALDCPAGYEDIGDGSHRCYMYSTENKTWTLAYTSCLTSANNKGNLLTIPDASSFYPQYYQIRNRGQDAWTGLLNIGNVHSWADGMEYDDALDAFFAADAGDGLYGYLSGEDGLFRLDDSSTERGYACYVDMSPPPPSPTPPPPACGEDWLQYEDMCYLFSGEQEYWGSAGHACHTADAELISIHDSGLLTFLLLQADSNTYWTGLENQGDKYAWEDGTNATDVAEVLGPYMDAWEEGKDCVAMNSPKFPSPLIHLNCMTQHNYICYKAALAGDHLVPEDLDFLLWA